MVEDHHGRTAAVQIIRLGAAKLLENRGKLRNAQAVRIAVLPPVHDHEAVVPRLVIADRAARVG